MSTPAACAGASAALPGQASAVDAGTTGVRAGCLTGRIVTTGTGQTQSDSLPFCPDVDGDGVADAPADGRGISAPPPPPTHTEIVAAVCPPIPEPAIGVSPPDFGVTGIETWLWDTSSPNAQSASGTIRGYPVQCTTTPARWTFDVGEPTAERYGQQRVYVADNPGSDSENTDVRHLWSTKGTYTLSIDIVWSRTSNYGQDTPANSTSRNYQVNEIISSPTTTP